jgi:hypothetical protein
MLTAILGVTDPDGSDSDVPRAERGYSSESSSSEVMRPLAVLFIVDSSDI